MIVYNQWLNSVRYFRSWNLTNGKLIAEFSGCHNVDPRGMVAVNDSRNTFTYDHNCCVWSPTGQLNQKKEIGQYLSAIYMTFSVSPSPAPILYNPQS
jgi:hypothetical protein